MSEHDMQHTCHVAGTFSRIKSDAAEAVIFPTPGSVSSVGTGTPAASAVVSKQQTHELDEEEP